MRRREGERAISPQHVVDAEAMETVSDHEEEDEQLGPEDDDEVTGKQRKENTNMMQLLNKDLLSFIQKTTASIQQRD